MSIIQNGVVFTSWTDGLLSAVDLKSGQALRTIANVAFETAPIIVGNHLYSYPMRPSTVYDLDLSTFAVLHAFPTPGTYAEHFPYDPSTGLCFLRCIGPARNDVLGALRLQDGSFAWSTALGFGYAWTNAGSPLVIGDGSVYVQDADGTDRVYRLDAKTGSIRWSTGLRSGTVVGYNNLIYDRESDQIYASSYLGSVFALRRSDGALLWSRDLPGYLISSSLTCHGGMVYLPLWSGLGAYAALDSSDGTVLWLQKGFFGEDGWSATAVGERYLYRQTHGLPTRIIVQDRFTGRLVWSADSGAQGMCPNPAESDGIVVFGNSYYLVALQAGIGLPVDCPWHGQDASGFNPGALTAEPVNHPPVLDAIPDVMASIGQPIVLTIAATDPENGQTLTFSLDSPPAGATIDPQTGIFNWTPLPTQDQRAYLITVRVSDDASPPATASRTFTVVVGDPDLGPRIDPLNNYVIVAGSTLSFTAVGTDGNPSSSSIHWSLGPGAPDGASIDSQSGLFLWSPPLDYPPSTNLITLRLTDCASPPLTATAPFQVTVIVPPQVRFASVAVDNQGPGFRLQLSVVPGGAYRIESLDLSAASAKWALQSETAAISNTLEVCVPAGNAHGQIFRATRTK